MQTVQKPRKRTNEENHIVRGPFPQQMCTLFLKKRKSKKMNVAT
jgi:hypothetical protein